MSSTVRYLREYFRPDSDGIAIAEVECARGEGVLHATVYRPARARAKLPGWVVLHGLTWSGREHPALVRFVRSVAAAGNIVLVPDIPEWRALRLTPAVTVETIKASVVALQQRDDVDHARAGLFGFSFGGTQALIAVTDPDVHALLHGIAAWGGYADVERLFIYGMTGVHELDGFTFRSEPDPYGAWIIAGQYLTSTPGYEDQHDVAAAVHALAVEAGRRRVYAGDPVFDATKARLRSELPRDLHELFDAIAPPTTHQRRDSGFSRHLALELAKTALRIDPLIDPRPWIGRVRVRTLLAHGRDDRLIPFTESIRLSRALDPATLQSCTITSLFSHSGGTQPGLGVTGVARESVRFHGILRNIMKLIER
jgi:dienelactone hydrolase